MNAPQARDRIFSELHASVLKPRGYRKSGSWSIRQFEKIHVALYLRSSRWNNERQAEFWLDLKVFHEDWHTLMTGERTFPAPKEGTPSLISEMLGSKEGPEHRHVYIDETVNLAQLQLVLVRRVREHMFPVEEQCVSPDGILSYMRSREDWPALALSAAGICLVMGQEVQAREYITLAKQRAPHENSLHWLENKEKAMWANRQFIVGRE